MVYISCEDFPPKEDRKSIFYWDTHSNQVETRLKMIANRKDVFLSVISDDQIEASQVRVPYLFDTKTSDYAHLKAQYKVVLEKNKQIQKPEISLIIPTFDHSSEIKKVIKSLYQQQGPFELIIIGTTKEEGTLKAILENAPMCRLKLITLNFERKLGDYRYAAGHMRNIGAVHSVSPRLLFMDSDILLPARSLELFVNNLDHHDLVMPMRRHQKGLLSRLFLKPTVREKDQHWLSFYSNPRSWSSLKSPWKYISTYTLGIKRSFFMKLGGFNPSFNSYGFEDVELGYRAYKNEASFKLLKLSVQHLFHHRKRSEYNNDETTRQKMLARTAQIFYMIHHDDEIYQELKYYLDENLYV